MSSGSERHAPHRRLRRLLQGAVLGLGAPFGWWLVHTLAGLTPHDPAYEFWLFTYISLGTVGVFSLFGFWLGREEQRLAHLTLVDPLTGLYNRRHFVDVLQAELARAKRTGRPLALLMLDIDHFKRVNDTWGHQAGDRVLQLLAQTVLHSIRLEDLAARVGGEEFAVIMPGLDDTTALQAAERLRGIVEHTPFAVDVTTTIDVRISVGIAATNKGTPADMDALISAADAALYRAKQTGRNRVCSAWQCVGIVDTE